MEKDKIILAINEAIFSQDHAHAELQDLIDNAERLRDEVIKTRAFLQSVYNEITKPENEAK